MDRMKSENTDEIESDLNDDELLWLEDLYDSTDLEEMLDKLFMRVDGKGVEI